NDIVDTSDSFDNKQVEDLLFFFFSNYITILTKLT
ncbi:hypothetical protein LCGC14_2406800, partial [marine sediment metagenome]